eukprot:1172019-Rhodomonas_salina.1
MQLTNQIVGHRDVLAFFARLVRTDTAIQYRGTQIRRFSTTRTPRMRREIWGLLPPREALRSGPPVHTRMSAHQSPRGFA